MMRSCFWPTGNYAICPCATKTPPSLFLWCIMLFPEWFTIVCYVISYWCKTRAYIKTLSPPCVSFVFAHICWHCMLDKVAADAETESTPAPPVTFLREGSCRVAASNAAATFNTFPISLFLPQAWLTPHSGTLEIVYMPWPYFLCLSAPVFIAEVFPPILPVFWGGLK